MSTLTQLLEESHTLGLVIGLSTFIIIGLFHPVVIKCEYHFGVRCWWWFLVLGTICLALSIMLYDVLWSSILGVAGFSSYWTIKAGFLVTRDAPTHGTILNKNNIHPPSTEHSIDRPSYKQIIRIALIFRAIVL